MLTPVEDVRNYVLSLGMVLEPVVTSATEIVGRVCACDVVAAADVPSFANSSRDGYAVRASDLTGSSVLELIGEVAAGASSDLKVEPGACMRIFTGAPVPAGADAVVQQEDVKADGSKIEVMKSVTLSQNIRAAGSDITMGQIAIAKGSKLRAAHVGVLASLGLSEMQTSPKPRVGVLSTGDEVVDPTVADLGFGQIRDSARPSLLAALPSYGVETVDLGHVADTPEALETVLAQTVSSNACDVIVTIGGVSVGAYDFIPTVLHKLAGDNYRGFGIAVKPGKPFATGRIQNVPVIGVPGNPVSAMVSWVLFGLPLINKMSGLSAEHWSPAGFAAVAAAPFGRQADGKIHVARAKVENRDELGLLHVAPVVGQESNQLGAMANADVLAVIPDGPGLAAGDKLVVWLLPER